MKKEFVNVTRMINVGLGPYDSSQYEGLVSGGVVEQKLTSELRALFHKQQNEKEFNFKSQIVDAGDN